MLGRSVTFLFTGFLYASSLGGSSEAVGNVTYSQAPLFECQFSGRQ